MSDTYFHLYCAATIRKKSFRLPNKLPRIVLDHEYTYPFLYHCLLAIFPIKIRHWAERVSGAVFDTISVVIVYLFSRWLFQTHSNPYLAEMVAALYAFSPGLLRMGSGPRAYNGSPRTMGQMLYVLHATSAFVGIHENSIGFLTISVISGSMLTVTAKFGTQVLLMFGIFFFGFFSVKYAAILGSSFALSGGTSRV